MHALLDDWMALCAVVLLLGMRHGFDADHLAAIDGITRISTRHRRPFAHLCGSLFSLGHGAVVLCIAAAVSLVGSRWSPPGWLNALGAWVSIGVLLLVGLVNLRAIATAAPRSVVTLVGVKGPLLRRLASASSPLGVAGVGALFALSFDTVSQAALFATTASQHGGLAEALTLGLLFMLGMVAADGLNGWWIARLLDRADHVAATASRIMSAAVTAISFAVAALGLGKLLSSVVDGWAEGRELALGCGVVLVTAVTYLVAIRLTGNRARCQSQSACA